MAGVRLAYWGKNTSKRRNLYGFKKFLTTEAAHMFNFI